MLKISAVSKSYGPDVVLRDVSFVLNRGERVGLVGPNGSGKSTLLQLLAGLKEPDSGSIQIEGDTVAYLPQYPLHQLHLSVRASLLQGIGISRVQRRLEELEAALQTAEPEQLEKVLAEYATAREEFERFGGYEIEARIETVLTGLRLESVDLAMPVSSLSGGNKTKLSLARLLLSGATILLLDEPTNYLDLGALLWLERFVLERNRGYVIVSHDRRFLDRTVSSILALDPVSHSIRTWPGNYSVYEESRRREREKRLEAYEHQQAEIARIEDDIRRTRQQAARIDGRNQSYYRRKGATRFQLGADRARAGKVARKAKVRERRLEEKLSGPDVIEKPVKGWNLHLAELGRNPIEDSRMVLEVEDVRAGYGDTEVLQGVSLLMRGMDRVALLGENGSGKSTLVRCIRGEIRFTGKIRLGPSIAPGFLSQEAAELPAGQTVLELFRARTEMDETEARAYLHRFLFRGEEVFKSVGALSWGQRAKLALAILMLSDANFLVLDEPTSHMDMPALQAIEEALASYEGPLLLVSHDRTFIERVQVNRVEVMEEGRLISLPSVEIYEQRLGGSGR